MPHTLGARLAQARREKAAREHRDVTQVDVAMAAGVSKTSVSRYESDTDVPRDPTLERICAFLGVTPAYLRYGVSSGTSVLDRVAPEPERPASELLQRKAPATKASAKKGRGRKAS
jgi:transcriptional regulator with XRE-family HTH domain